ncbi:hypothetical protein B0T10DRAFT_466813 [Thelonectria olida]|uniref:DUF1996 domain-containing protein n=1 Tax=Thelonectria olida TaxID=1576542 RepID=A0A9P9AIN5_9HYPO|nr:hypothetical protein B0T10DRAFT_466813 [Thelonectria olida]
MRSLSFILAGAGAASAYTITVLDRFMYKNIDPIVFPGEYGKSHMHSFFGSDAVTANTTTSAELQAGCSTAENPNDYSIYWVPTLYLRNSSGTQPILVNRFSAYYVSIENAEIAIPQDFKTVAGNVSAVDQSGVDTLTGVQWFCEGDATEDKDLAAFPTTTCSTHLQTLLLFHDCVNPDTLDSAYSGTQNWRDGFKPANRCPSGMKRIPQLRFSIRYDLRSILPEGWSGQPPFELACGSSYCSHGDFINGWLPEAAENMLLANDKREFAGVDGPAGAYNAGSVCGAENAQDADPEHGTSDYEESRALLGLT